MCNVPGSGPGECHADYKLQYFSLVMPSECSSAAYSMFRLKNVYIIVLYTLSAPHSGHILVFTSPIRLLYPAHVFHLNEHYSPFGSNSEHNQWFFQLVLTHFLTTNQSQPHSMRDDVIKYRGYSLQQ